jgi:two-component system LytT family response regulator
MSDLRAVVVDDEPLAREGLAEQLGTLAGVAVVATFADAPAALAGLDAAQADVMFVDIQMPGMSGIELVETLAGEPMPAVIFVTAYDAYAIRAFEVNALDYLLKPVALDRLAQSVERVRKRVLARDEAAERARLGALLATLPQGRAPGVGRLMVREVGQVIIVATQDVDWIEGADYYAKLHVGAKVHLLRETLASLEQRLDAARFLRVHKSAIVNLSRVTSVESAERGDAVAVLSTGAKVKVMRAHRSALETKLEALHDDS